MNLKSKCLCGILIFREAKIKSKTNVCMQIGYTFFDATANSCTVRQRLWSEMILLPINLGYSDFFFTFALHCEAAILILFINNATRLLYPPWQMNVVTLRVHVGFFLAFSSVCRILVKKKKLKKLTSTNPNCIYWGVDRMLWNRLLITWHGGGKKSSTV